jgi:hypothetical protein
MMVLGECPVSRAIDIGDPFVARRRPFVEISGDYGPFFPTVIQFQRYGDKECVRQITL